MFYCQSLFTALDNVRDIVQVTDSDHKVTWVNQAAEKVDIIIVIAVITTTIIIIITINRLPGTRRS